MSALPELVVLRGLREADLNFLRSSWLKSYRALYTVVPKDAYFRLHHEVIHGLLDRPTTRTVVACAREHEDQILGYACAEPTEQRFHWAYVKDPFRKQGIARALVTAALAGAAPGTIIATHTLPDGLAARMMARGWSIRPAIAMYLALGGRAVSPPDEAARWRKAAEEDARERRAHEERAPARGARGA